MSSVNDASYTMKSDEEVLRLSVGTKTRTLLRDFEYTRARSKFLVLSYLVDVLYPDSRLLHEELHAEKLLYRRTVLLLHANAASDNLFQLRVIYFLKVLRRNTRSNLR